MGYSNSICMQNIFVKMDINLLGMKCNKIQKQTFIHVRIFINILFQVSSIRTLGIVTFPMIRAVYLLVGRSVIIS